MPHDLSMIQRRGLMYVLSSPSGAGKTTISRALLKNNEKLMISMSVTTRERRPGEVNGQDYHFVDIPTFNQMIENGEFLEHAKVHDNYYGTPRSAVEEALSKGFDIAFDIDWQGTQQLAEMAPKDLVTVFILPPSSEELARRLRMRAQDTEEVILRRLSKAADEMSHFSEYDYVIINRDIDKSIDQTQKILDAERLKRSRVTGLSDFVRTLKQSL